MARRGFHLTLMCCIIISNGLTWLVLAHFEDNLNAEEGQTAILKCVLCDSNFTLPEWRSLSSMVIFNQNSSTINQNMSADLRNRIEQSPNRRDIFLNNVHVSDAGDYQCSYSGKGHLTISLSVSGTSGTSFPWWGIFLFTITGLFLVGVAIGTAKFCRVNSVFKTTHTEKRGIIHDTIRFVHTPKNDVDVTWYYNNSPIEHSWKHAIEKNGKIRILQIRNVHKEDCGTYSVFTTYANKPEAEYILIVDEEPWEVYLHKHSDFGFGFEICDATQCISDVTDGGPADRSLKLEIGDYILKVNDDVSTEISEKLKELDHIKLLVKRGNGDVQHNGSQTTDQNSSEEEKNKSKETKILIKMDNKSKEEITENNHQYIQEQHE